MLREEKCLESVFEGRESSRVSDDTLDDIAVTHVTMEMVMEILNL